MSKSAQALREFLDSAVQGSPSLSEKVASAPKDTSADQIVGMSVALGNAYRDPILAGILESGDVRRFSQLASGRHFDSETAQKVAGMGLDDVRELTAQGLKLTHVQKTAEVEKHRSAFKHLFKR